MTLAPVARRVALAVVALLLLARLRPLLPVPTLCPWRAMTGLPCPFCGGTSAAVDAAHGQVLAAVRASPLGLALVLSWPVVDRLRRPGWWARRNLRVLTIVVSLVASEMWQLERFGWLAA